MTSRILPLMLALGMLLVLSIAGRSACPVRSMWGLKCPACGLTRAMTAVWQGDLLAATYWHLLVIPSLVGLLVFVIRPPQSWIPWWVCGGILVFFTVVRNLSFYFLY